MCISLFLMRYNNVSDENFNKDTVEQMAIKPKTFCGDVKISLYHSRSSIL